VPLNKKINDHEENLNELFAEHINVYLKKKEKNLSELLLFGCWSGLLKKKKKSFSLS
jgi:hypothetical protein